MLITNFYIGSIDVPEIGLKKYRAIRASNTEKQGLKIVVNEKA